MKLIILSSLGALILLGVGTYILLHFSDKIKLEERLYLRLEAKWLYGFLGYTCVISAIFIVLVLQTSLTQQEKSLQNTQERFQNELREFRERLSDQTEKLFSQVNEKAELTGSEVEVRGKLKNEIDHHNRTRQELTDAQVLLRQIQNTLNTEIAAHRAYLDSLNTERAVHAATKTRLDRETQLHSETQDKLQNARQNLAQSQERLKVQENQLKELSTLLERAQINERKALENAELAGKQLLQKANDQQQNLKLIQTATDSIYKKVMKRPRPGETETPEN